jgi:hypothetical protein
MLFKVISLKYYFCRSGISASNPYVPLSYSSIDQRKFFKRPEKESIQDILESLESMKEDSKWPFQNEDTCRWIAADQPQTHVQVCITIYMIKGKIIPHIFSIASQRRFNYI